MKALLAAVLKNQRDCLRKILSRLVLRSTLAVSTRDFWTVRDEPVLVTLEDRCEFVLHRWISAFYQRFSPRRYRGELWTSDFNVRHPDPRLSNDRINATHAMECDRRQISTASPKQNRHDPGATVDSANAGAAVTTSTPDVEQPRYRRVPQIEGPLRGWPQQNQGRAPAQSGSACAAVLTHVEIRRPNRQADPGGFA